MTFSDFWNSAFLAALHRVPASKAKAEADKATQIAIAHWDKYAGETVASVTPKADLDIARFPRQVPGRKDLTVVRI